MRKILIPVVLCTTMLVGCDSIKRAAQATLSGGEQEQLAEYQAQISMLEAQVAAVEAEAEREVKAAYEDARVGRTEELSGRLNRLLEIQQRHEDTVRLYGSAVEGERRLLAKGNKDLLQGVLGWVAPIIPAPVQPLIPFASSLAVMLFSSRARKHTGKALLATAKGSLGEAAGLLLKAVGAKHSSDEPATIVGGAIKMAKLNGADADQIAKLEQVKSELES